MEYVFMNYSIIIKPFVKVLIQALKIYILIFLIYM